MDFGIYYPNFGMYYPNPVHRGEASSLYPFVRC